MESAKLEYNAYRRTLAWIGFFTVVFAIAKLSVWAERFIAVK